MVKPKSSFKKKNVRNTKRAFKKRAFKKSYSRKSTKTFTRMAKKSLTHSSILNTKFYDDAIVNGVKYSQVGDKSDAHNAIIALLTKSNKYYNMHILRGYDISLGSEDPESVGVSLSNSIIQKHINIVRSLDGQGNAFTEISPNVAFHGIKVKYIGKPNSQSYQTDAMHMPSILYQPYANSPIQDIVFTSGRIYIKFPKIVNGVLVQRVWPTHFHLFNVNSVKIKVYYSIGNSKGRFQAQGSTAQHMQIDF